MKKQIVRLKHKWQAELMLIWLIHERQRHESDIDAINKDIRTLIADWEIDELPFVPRNLYFEVSKHL